METKLIAAEIATAAGVTTIITSSKHPKSIFDILDYNTSAFPQSSKSTPSTPLEPLSRRASRSPSPEASNSEVRPPHTLFKPSPTPLRDLKSWTSHTLSPAGGVIIDAGAHNVLARRESGGRLLAAGVLDVRGAFASGQAVRILVRRRRKGEGADGEVGSPEIPPALSRTESGFDLSRAMDSVTVSNEEQDLVVMEKQSDPEIEEWEIEEVGRGLASYNSAQIAKVRGVNRCAVHSLDITEVLCSRILL